MDGATVALEEPGFLLPIDGGEPDVARALDAGAARVILGTAAIENPELVAQAVAQFGADQIAVGIDARDGRVKTRGWVRETAVTLLPLILLNAGAMLPVYWLVYSANRIVRPRRVDF
jgi:hypothetical protein